MAMGRMQAGAWQLRAAGGGGGAEEPPERAAARLALRHAGQPLERRGKSTTMRAPPSARSGENGHGPTRAWLPGVRASRRAPWGK